MVTLSKEDILTIHAEEVSRGKNKVDARQGTRAVVYSLLHIKNPSPKKSDVTDAHRIAVDHARETDPTIKDALHLLQKMHQTDLWQETDRLVNAALGGTP